MAQTFRSVTHKNDSAFQALGIFCPFYVWDRICASNMEAEADTAVSLIILFVLMLLITTSTHSRLTGGLMMWIKKLM